MNSPNRPNILLLVALTAFGPVSTDLYLPSLPDMTRVFATDVSRVQLTLSAFIAGFAVAQLILGPLSDRYGRRPVLLAGIGFYLAASVFCLFAPSIGMLILGRFLQALGGCAGPVLARAIVRDSYPRHEAARVLSTMASIMALAPAIGPFIGGALQAGFGWRANFVVFVLFVAGLLAAAWRLLEETNRHPDRRASHPLLMLENYAALLANRRFLGYTLTLSLAFAWMFSFISGSSFVLIGSLGVKPQYFGFCFIAVVAGYMSGSFTAARLSARIGIERMIGFGVLLGICGGAVLAGLAWAGVATVPAVVAPVSVMFFAAGLTLPNSTAAALAPHASIAGSASALLGFVQMAAGALAGWLVGRLHDGTTLPMAGVIAGAALGAFLAHQLLVSRQAS